MSTKKLQIIGTLSGKIKTDKTLTKEDYAADAKAVGDALETKTEEFQLKIANCIIINPVIDAICDGTIFVLNESNLNYAIIA